MRDLTIRFKHPLNSVFDGCRMSIVVKSIDADRYDVELYITGAKSDVSLLLTEVQQIDAATVDSVLDVWLGKLINRGWRRILA